MFSPPTYITLTVKMMGTGEPAVEDESDGHIDSAVPLANSLHSGYMNDSSFSESVEGGVLYSVVLPGSGNIIGGKSVLLRNFENNIEKAFNKDVGIKMALGSNPRSTPEGKGKDLLQEWVNCNFARKLTQGTKDPEVG
jgi:hypothetical protein